VEMKEFRTRGYAGMFLSVLLRFRFAHLAAAAFSPSALLCSGDIAANQFGPIFAQKPRRANLPRMLRISSSFNECLQCGHAM